MKHFLLLFLLVVQSIVWAQPLYNMSNQTANDCQGILLDSDLGQPAGNYDHNEDYIFTICPPGDGFVTLTFAAFCLEAPYDYIEFFDGADTLAPQIGGTYTGQNSPGTVSSTGSCLTVYFHSDANVACTGWISTWDSEIIEPEFPEMTLADLNPPCSTSTVTVYFDAPVACSSLSAANFSVSDFPSVSAINPGPCTNDSTTSVEITLNPGLNQSGYFVVEYNNVFTDICGNVFNIQRADTLAVTTCPLYVEMDVPDSVVCIGECVDIDSDPFGGDFLHYSYAWSPNIGNGDGPYSVCPNVTTTYTVTVTDGTGASATNSITIVVLPLPTVLSPLTICASAAPTTLVATPAGGTWAGAGITDSLLGVFDPSVTGAGTFDISYTDPAGCIITTQIIVNDIWAGIDEAACPGTAPFNLSYFSPQGGTWSGPNVSAAGVFTPVANGTYTLTYSANGCTDTKDIIVAPINLTPIDTICTSADTVQLQFSPLGGNWTGAGILNDYWGTWLPDAIQSTGDQTLTYSIHGCSLSFDVYVKYIEAFGDFVTCPNQSPFLLSPTAQPAGGTWSGIGIANPSTGLYNPALVGGTWTPDTLTYSVNGCTDERIAYVVLTRILVDTLQVCTHDSLELNWQSVQSTPWNGAWTGAGVVSAQYPAIFMADSAGAGYHTLYYDANTCLDSIVIYVRPNTVPADTAVCEFSPPFDLIPLLGGGSWSGTGITDATQGTFSPSNSGIGTFEIAYETADFCVNTMNVTVFQLAPVQITGLAPSYCDYDSAYVLSAFPPGGVFSGDGIVGDTFNPVLAGTGLHIITYTYGSGNCFQTGTAVTNVFPPLAVNLASSKDSLCFGDFSTLTATASGGATAVYTYAWADNAAITVPVRPVNPSATFTYIVIANDGCSTPARDSFTLVVAAPIQVQFALPDTACFGERGIVVASVNGSGNYLFEWDTNPPQIGDTLRGQAFKDYDVRITDLISGCSVQENIYIPGFPYVRAQFLTNPTGDCALITDATFNFIDMSGGASRGYWDFGDGTDSLPYVLGQQPSHTYADTGKYVVTLHVENASGCRDTWSDTLCVKPEFPVIYIPNAFTPNGDTHNDYFSLSISAVATYEMRIFDRWGTLVFQSDDPTISWDGRYKDRDCPEGVYVYKLTLTQYANNPRTSYAPVEMNREGTITLIR